VLVARGGGDTLSHTDPPSGSGNETKHVTVPSLLPADPLRYAQRWIVERSTAWLQNSRRVLVRHDRLLTPYRAFVLLACVMITPEAPLR